MDPAAAVFLVVLVPLGLWLGRKLSLWYFRINDAIAVLEGIHAEMRKANGEAIAPPVPVQHRSWVGRLDPRIEE